MAMAMNVHTLCNVMRDYAMGQNTTIFELMRMHAMAFSAMSTIQVLATDALLRNSLVGSMRYSVNLFT